MNLLQKLFKTNTTVPQNINSDKTESQKIVDNLKFNSLQVVELKELFGTVNYYLLEEDVNKIKSEIKEKSNYSYKIKQLTGENVGKIYTIQSNISLTDNYIYVTDGNSFYIKINNFRNKHNLDKDKNQMFRIFGESVTFKQLLRIYKAKNKRKFSFDINSEEIENMANAIHFGEQFKAENQV